jgi:hypothetical protein
MNIEQITTGTLTGQDLPKSRSSIPDGEGGYLLGEDGMTPCLVRFEQGGERCIAVFLVPDNAEDKVEFICAGRSKTASWMRGATESYIQSRREVTAEGIDVPEQGAFCSSRIFEAAVAAGYGVVASPLGMMDLVKHGEGYTLTISNEAWMGEEGKTPAVAESAWFSSRVEIQAGEEVGHIELLQPLPLDIAIETNAQLAALQVVAPEEVQLSFETLADLKATLPVQPVAAERAAPEVEKYQGDVIDFLGEEFDIADPELVIDEVVALASLDDEDLDDEDMLLDEEQEDEVLMGEDLEDLLEQSPRQSHFGF